MISKLTLAHLPPDQFCTYVHHSIPDYDPRWVHNHDFHELFWVEENEGLHWINGKAISLRRGDLILIHASDCHTVGGNSKDLPLRIVNFAFHAKAWDVLRRRYFGGKDVFFSNPGLAARSYQLDEFQLAAIRQAAGGLRSGLRDQLQTETFLLSVLALLQADRFNTKERAAPAWVREACTAIGQNRNFAGGMPALARLADRSPEHISREFRRYLNRTPTEVINDARTSHAADRLATTDDPILMIALDCGLENLSHFYRLFRSRYNCTPRAYRLRERSVIGSKRAS
jgi:AraC family transcriptional regulator, dual regulator of chb operon